MPTITINIMIEMIIKYVLQPFFKVSPKDFPPAKAPNKSNTQIKITIPIPIYYPIVFLI